MKVCLLASLVLWPALSLGQPSPGMWEDPFDFGSSFEDRISAIHLIHVYDGSTGKMVALPNDWDCDAGCGDCEEDPPGA